MKNYLAVSLFGLLISMSASCLAQSENSALDKRCKVVEQTTDEMYENGALIQCYFPNMVLLNAYQEYRDLLGDDRKYLAKKLISNKDVDVNCTDDNCSSIHYRWSGDKQLNIEQNFAGGETTLKFIQKNNDTHLDIRYFPD